MSLSLPTCTSLLVLALTILPAAVSAAVLPGVPKANLTVYHVNPMSFGGIPFNMDTGYLKLFLFFLEDKRRMMGFRLESPSHRLPLEEGVAYFVQPTLTTLCTQSAWS